MMALGQERHRHEDAGIRRQAEERGTHAHLGLLSCLASQGVSTRVATCFSKIVGTRHFFAPSSQSMVP